MHVANRSVCRQRRAARATLACVALTGLACCSREQRAPPAAPATAAAPGTDEPTVPRSYPPIQGPASLMTAPARTLEVNGLLNSGFEWIADSTTDPPKYGAYWLGAF